jgi:transcription factor MYB, plant
MHRIGFSYACAGVQESSLDGTCTQPTSIITGETMRVGVESSSSTPTASSASAMFGSMEDEIDMLLQQMRSFEEDGLTLTGEVANGVECFFGEVDHVILEGSAGSSCPSPGVDSVFQDFVQGYDQ